MAGHELTAPPPGRPVLDGLPERVALVHDYLVLRRGAERTFAAMADCFPDADVFTLLYDADVAEALLGRAVGASPLQRLGITAAGYRYLFPLFPLAARTLPVDGHELVVSSSSAFAHGVKVAPEALHVCYCHSPFRYAWHAGERALAEAPRPLRPALRPVLRAMRRWDRAAAASVTHYIANSAITKERIRHFYGRDAPVVHPPVEIARFRVADPEDYFLVVSEVNAHKRIDLALEAARRARRRIRVVGDGPLLRSLAAEYRGTAEFLGRVDDEVLTDLYSRALALIVPSVEEFGIAAVEAQASGRPVVAAGAGGCRETVVANETGVFFRPGDVQDLAERMRTTDFAAFQPQAIRQRAARFSPSSFQQALVRELQAAVGSPRVEPREVV